MPFIFRRLFFVANAFTLTKMNERVFSIWATQPPSIYHSTRQSKWNWQNFWLLKWILHFVIFPFTVGKHFSAGAFNFAYDACIGFICSFIQKWMWHTEQLLLLFRRLRWGFFSSYFSSIHLHHFLRCIFFSVQLGVEWVTM